MEQELNTFVFDCNVIHPFKQLTVYGLMGSWNLYLHNYINKYEYTNIKKLINVSFWTEFATVNKLDYTQRTKF